MYGVRYQVVPELVVAVLEELVEASDEARDADVGAVERLDEVVHHLSHQHREAVEHVRLVSVCARPSVAAPATTASIPSAPLNMGSESFEKT